MTPGPPGRRLASPGRPVRPPAAWPAAWAARWAARSEALEQAPWATFELAWQRNVTDQRFEAGEYLPTYLPNRSVPHVHRRRGSAVVLLLPQ